MDSLMPGACVLVGGIVSAVPTSHVAHFGRVQRVYGSGTCIKHLLSMFALYIRMLRTCLQTVAV